MNEKKEIDFATFEKLTRPFYVSEYEIPKKTGRAEFADLATFFRAVSRSAGVQIPLLYRRVRGEISTYYTVGNDNTVLIFTHNTIDRNKAIQDAREKANNE